MTDKQPYDTIIIGGGLSGLSAACEPACGRKTLLLEAESRLGGKIQSRHRKGVSYEVGALFAYDPQWFPFAIHSGPLNENHHPIALYHQGKLHSGHSVPACLNGLGPEIRQRLNLKTFLAAPSPQPAMIGEDMYRSLNAFLQVIHPGNLTEYIPSRRQDSLFRHPVKSYAGRNETLVQALAAQCSADIRVNARVYALENLSENETTTVAWRDAQGLEHSACAKKVILSLPAPESRILCRSQNNVSTAFLNRLRYGSGIVVVLECNNTDWSFLSYLVSTQGMVNTFFFHYPSENTSRTIVTAYLVAEKAAACRDMSDAELSDLVISELAQLPLGDMQSCGLSLLEVKKWPGVGPIIDTQAYHGFSSTWLHPMPGVILAGDYTWWDEEQMPYGMWAAIASGRRAAQRCPIPGYPPVKIDFARSPLAETVTSSSGESGPVVRERFSDGAIAYYGLLLQAEPDQEDLEHYLLMEAKDHLWGYHQGYGVTSLDSALVMEGLLATKKYPRELQLSCKRLVETFFDEHQSGFRTIPVGDTGRADYWQGVDCPATAACAWLVLQIDPDGFSEVIHRCCDYLLKKQQVNGGWPGKWFPSFTLPIWYAVRVLKAAADMHISPAAIDAALERAVLQLASRQEHNGSWGNSVIETSAALLALKTVNAGPEAVERGAGRLQTMQGGQGWQGEPILEYWFEEKGQRTLYSTRDTGKIASAWARLALQAVQNR